MSVQKNDPYFLFLRCLKEAGVRLCTTESGNSSATTAHGRTASGVPRRGSSVEASWVSQSWLLIGRGPGG